MQESLPFGSLRTAPAFQPQARPGVREGVTAEECRRYSVNRKSVPVSFPAVRILAREGVFLFSRSRLPLRRAATGDSSRAAGPPDVQKIWAPLQ